MMCGLAASAKERQKVDFHSAIERSIEEQKRLEDKLDIDSRPSLGGRSALDDIKVERRWDENTRNKAAFANEYDK